MAVLTVQNVSKYWGVDLLFQEISLLMNAGEKIALVGRNGTGKTTLLKILMGRMEYDSGRIFLGQGCRMGYLSQDPEFTPGNTVLAEARSVFAYLQKWEQDLRNLEEQMGAESDEAALEAIMADYAHRTAQFEAAGGYEAPAKVKSVLFGLGFSEEELDRPVEILSGGQKVRLGLAKLLLDGPELMLLDEPTNHLDLHAVEWLEGHFRNMKSAAILVSHDRYFLDKVINRTLEIDGQTGHMYHGNYSYFLSEKKRRLEAAMSEFDRQQREIARLQSFVQKWKAGTRSTQAKSREKMLERMELIERPTTPTRSMKLSFDMDYESGDDVLKVENLSKAYGEKVLFAGVNAELSKGDRVALVGPNGAGKSTFLKIVHGLLKQTTGSYFWGVGVERGYFSQDLDDLNSNRTALEEISDLPGFTKFDAYSLLGRFLFSGDDAHKLIGQCSGGERNRLILAKLMVAGANVLLLDEPTNHLDLESKQVLEEALAEFPGTVMFVSHDRFFVDQVATKVWEFEGGTMRVWEGNYSAYKAEKEKLALLAEQAQAHAQPAVERPEAERPAAVQAKPAESSQAHRVSRKEERRAAEALRRLEAEIGRLEERKAELEERMSDPDLYKSAEGRQMLAEYNATQGELARLYVEWEKAAE